MENLEYIRNCHLNTEYLGLVVKMILIMTQIHRVVLEHAICFMQLPCSKSMLVKPLLITIDLCIGRNMLIMLI